MVGVWSRRRGRPRVLVPVAELKSNRQHIAVCGCNGVHPDGTTHSEHLCVWQWDQAVTARLRTELSREDHTFGFRKRGATPEAASLAGDTGRDQSVAFRDAPEEPQPFRLATALRKSYCHNSATHRRANMAKGSADRTTPPKRSGRRSPSYGGDGSLADAPCRRNGVCFWPPGKLSDANSRVR